MVKTTGAGEAQSFVLEAARINGDPTLTVHPLASEDGVIVKVNPPTKPINSNLPHVPCDIVLVIDVSGSMGSNAPAPTVVENGSYSLEDYGMTVLDLTKHAAHTIMETLNEGDRLGIVTFGSDITVCLIISGPPKKHIH